MLHAQQPTSPLPPCPPLFHRRHGRRPTRVKRPAKSRLPTFFPTYRGAVEWTRRHQSVLETTLGLLETYPSLIQEPSLDRLWMFLAPYVCKRLDGVNDRSAQQRDAANSFSTKPCDVRTMKRSIVVNSKGLTPSYPGHAKPDTATHVSGSYRHSACFHADRRSDSGEPHVPVISVTSAPDDFEPELQALMFSRQLNHEEFHGSPSGDDSPRPHVYVSSVCGQQRQEASVQAWPTLHQDVLHALQHHFYVRTGPCCCPDCRPTTAAAACVDLHDADLCIFVLDEPSLNTPACFRALSAARAMDLPVVFLKHSSYSLPSPLPEFIMHHNHLGLESQKSSRNISPLPPLNRPRRSATPEMMNHKTKLSSGLLGRPKSANSSQRRPLPEQRDNNDMLLYLLKGYRDAVVFDKDRREESQVLLRQTVCDLLTSRPKTADGERLTVSPSKTLTLLQKLSAKERNYNLLSVPSVTLSSPCKIDSSGLADFLSDVSEVEDSRYHLSSPSDVSISVFNTPSPDLHRHHSHHRKPDPSPSSSRRLSPGQQSTLLSSSSFSTPMSGLRSALPQAGSPTDSLGISSTLLVSPAVLSVSSFSNSRSPSSGRASSSHLQQQLRTRPSSSSRASSSPASSVLLKAAALETLDHFDERQTTYLVCRKIRGSPALEPRLVKWPPREQEEERNLGRLDRDGGVEDLTTTTGATGGRTEVGETLSESVFSDSPVSFRDFRDLDLSIVVNEPRGSDSPDSDASTFF